MGISFEPNTSPRGTLPLSHTFLQVNNTACREKNLLNQLLTSDGRRNEIEEPNK